MDYPDKRRYRRIPVLVECRVEGASGRVEMRMTDLTPLGCYVDTTVAFPAGEKVTLHAALGEEELSLSGRVIPMQQTGWGFGIEFVDLDATVRQQLESYYEQHVQLGAP